MVLHSITAQPMDDIPRFQNPSAAASSKISIPKDSENMDGHMNHSKDKIKPTKEPHRPCITDQTAYPIPQIMAHRCSQRSTASGNAPKPKFQHPTAGCQSSPYRRTPVAIRDSIQDIRNPFRWSRSGKLQHFGIILYKPNRWVIIRTRKHMV